MEVIDVMLRNNLEVKKCFFAVKRAQGTMPDRIDVSFSLSSSGKGSGLSVKQADYKGTELERCLGSAVGGISFPPSTSGSTRVSYPFIMK
jgi:hypothetical protein